MNDELVPLAFMFQLTEQESESIRSQFATLKTGRGQHRKYLPYAFTQHGAIMAAMILNSQRATEVSVLVVRAFVQLRELVMSNQELSLRLNELEIRTELMSLRQESFAHNTRDQLKQVFDALRVLMAPPQAPIKRPIGFVTPDDSTTKPKEARRNAQVLP